MLQHVRFPARAQARAMSNMKIVELIAATNEQLMAAVKTSFVSEQDLQLAINLIDDELIALRERVKRLEQGGVSPYPSAGSQKETANDRDTAKIAVPVVHRSQCREAGWLRQRRAGRRA